MCLPFEVGIHLLPLGLVEAVNERLREFKDKRGELVVFRGIDSGTVDGISESICFERSLRIDDARGAEVLLAYAMNGEPLPVQHGYIGNGGSFSCAWTNRARWRYAPGRLIWRAGRSLKCRGGTGSATGVTRFRRSASRSSSSFQADSYGQSDMFVLRRGYHLNADGETFGLSISLIALGIAGDRVEKTAR
jgi:hypothetical protein